MTKRSEKETAALEVMRHRVRQILMDDFCGTTLDARVSRIMQNLIPIMDKHGYHIDSEGRTDDPG